MDEIELVAGQIWYPSGRVPGAREILDRDTKAAGEMLVHYRENPWQRSGGGGVFYTTEEKFRFWINRFSASLEPDPDALS